MWLPRRAQLCRAETRTHKGQETSVVSPRRSRCSWTLRASTVPLTLGKMKPRSTESGPSAMRTKPSPLSRLSSEKEAAPYNPQSLQSTSPLTRELARLVKSSPCCGWGTPPFPNCDITYWVGAGTSCNCRRPLLSLWSHTSANRELHWEPCESCCTGTKSTGHRDTLKEDNSH